MKCYISFRDVQFTQLWNGYQIVVITDVPCHLYMRWSYQHPWTHTIPAYRRGTSIPSETYYCFTVYKDNEQDEAGDTLTHTFVKTPWVHCETRYFYFYGSQAGLTCESTSPIFIKHFNEATAPPGPVDLIIPAEYSARTISSSHGTWATAWGGFSEDITPERQLPTFLLQSQVYETVSWFIRRAHLSFPIPELLYLYPITEARLSLYINTRDNVPTPLCVTEGLQSDPLIAEDWKFQNLMTTIYSAVALNALTPGAYNDFVFGAAGKDWIKYAAQRTHQYESFDSSENAYASCYGNNWLWQSFTPDQAHAITAVKLRLKKKLGTPATYYCDIYNTTALGKPTGAALATGQFDGNLITTSVWGEWITFRLFPALNLEYNKLYAIVLRSPLSLVTDYCEWILTTVGTYAGGRSGYSLTGGLSWVFNPVAYDHHFITYNNLNYGLLKLRVSPVPDVTGVQPPPAFQAKSTLYTAQKGAGFQPLLYITYQP